ncbi:MAG: DEAD/DEAH box helicase [Candidatus Marinimicrobia bacterium]|nr:DEAD/DEAH box helicase [Candidatus Neomarinimicrobiota bacterium]
MKAILNASVQIIKETTPQKILHHIREDLTYPNPEFTQKARFDYYLGDTSKTIKSYEDDAEYLTVPRGYAYPLIKLAEKQQFKIDWEDLRISHPNTIITDSDFTLRDYQIKAKEAFIKREQGVIVVPCGGGKTIVAMSIMDEVKEPTLIIVHTIDLLNQWVDNLKEKLGIENIGIISGPTNTLENVTVSTIQSLRNHPNLTQLSTDFGMVILDEAHHVPADTFRKVLNQFQSKYRLGLSATPNRADGLTDILYHTIGRKVYEVDYPYLIDNGFLIKPTYKVIRTGFDFNPQKQTPSGRMILDWHRMAKHLISQPTRNELIYSVIFKTHTRGELALILSGRVDHLKMMYGTLKDKYRCAILIGATKKKERIEILKKARAEELDILFSANVSDEGLDMPNLKRVYLTFPNKSESKVIQRIGRILRPYPDKTSAEVYDFVDDKVPALVSQARQRINIFKKTFGSYTNGEF